MMADKKLVASALQRPRIESVLVHYLNRIQLMLKEMPMSVIRLTPHDRPLSAER